MKDIKLLNIDFTNETLLLILPFNTGYLLRIDTDAAKDIPCEHSVKAAMMLQSVEHTINPHKTMADPFLQ
tara:strand:+ start:1340 stop:1549 length:210 start_codon:yes stop_codon:yes gene_type:complete